MASSGCQGAGPGSFEKGRVGSLAWVASHILEYLPHKGAGLGTKGVAETELVEHTW